MRVTARICATLIAAVLAGAVLAQGAHGTANAGQAKSEKEKLAKHEAAYTKAKRAYEADPKRPADKRKTLVEATVQFGATTMVSPVLTSQVKYPKALRLFREALKLDPKHAKAREYRDLIEGIYKSMGKPVPKS